MSDISEIAMKRITYINDKSDFIPSISEPYKLVFKWVGDFEGSCSTIHEAIEKEITWLLTHKGEWEDK